MEGAVYELAGEVTASGQPVLQRYGISDDTAFSVGLTCGGIIDIFVQPVSRQTFPELGEIADAVAAGRPGRRRHRDQRARPGGRPADHLGRRRGPPARVGRIAGLR